MRTSFFLAPLLAAGLVIACSSAEKRSAFDTTTNATDPKDAGKGPPTFQPNGHEGDNTDDGGCSQSQTTITRTPVVIEFLVDESGSMDSEGKWDAAVSALTAAFDDMHTTADPATFIGMMRFSSFVDHQVKPKAMTSDPDDQQYTDLTDAINADGPNGGTETLTGLTAAYKVVDSFKPPAAAGLDTTDMRRIVVLMSDGAPSGGVPEQQKCEDLDDTQFAMTPPAGPINTFAIGIGPFPSPDPTDYDPVFMGTLAQKGGGQANPNCDPAATDPTAVCHFQVTPGDDVNATKQAFIDAINKIRALSASCDFGFSITGDADLKNIAVTMTGSDGAIVTIPKDSDNGWTFDDDTHPTKVILHGDACSASNGTVSGRVDVTLGCRSAQ